MKVKTSELTDVALDWAVLGSMYPNRVETINGFLSNWSAEAFRFSTSWAHGGPIIEREKIEIVPSHGGTVWYAESFVGSIRTSGPMPLIAAMRCYVASKLGDEVEVPDELI